MGQSELKENDKSFTGKRLAEWKHQRLGMGEIKEIRDSLAKKSKIFFLRFSTQNKFILKKKKHSEWKRI